ncbi:PREDICTED: germin-like protein subfamily 1 member 8 isoform X3 [Tarenaya hassleriana]|uniref:germin-like protein subfamily 1 member 8 isoform X3 n=1 Tax=Tarenaya hassleriana TaxID=28532 RepID=UPI0008FD4FDF|nr:PREDICTED: germin-like protein subfamily 1 member 8 isoform X3 [Tarenaya hassleriana]
MGIRSFFSLFLLSVTIPYAMASDPSPLQDFCVAVNNPANALFVNGKFCKDPKLVTADDFFKSGFDKAGNTTNRIGSSVTAFNVDTLPGLNTLGISLVRIDYAPFGQNPPHTHPRATEGLIHFQFNPTRSKAVAFAALSSQNPGVITIANSVFGSKPAIDPIVLSKAFQLDVNVVKNLQTKF